ncbi:transcription dna-binding motility swrb swarming ylxl regulation bh2428 [Lucifera butyrica]|uniref:Transcription dna-binding motility swrb swarming ylxl regulation bh2428 n=1 Tax=Lucifera butyrica TaxID=1351585 RepID=A0A498R5S2_9FIRM|nr:hypothetical protein [Lucifera butyrica]VBB08066.1 transcription dna-binding motility swrb swarming ylxl regulation bh2428 [Lucifera butyrica]
MFTEMVVLVISLFFLVYFIIYKRKMLINLFSLNAATPTNELQTRLEETADIILTRLEEKINHLEYLLHEADCRIAQLENRTGNLSAVPEAGEPAEQTAVFPAGKYPVTAYQEAEMLARQLKNEKSADNGERIAEETEMRSGEPLNNDKHRLILQLADQGYSVTEIAKETGMGKGEVLLVLQLHKKYKNMDTNYDN